MTLNATLNDVIYNAAEQAFEGVVTIDTGNGTLRYAATFHAPIATEFDDAAKGLIARAERMHALNRGMRASAIQRLALPTRVPQRAGRTAPARWLDALLSHARAA